MQRIFFGSRPNKVYHSKSFLPNLVKEYVLIGSSNIVGQVGQNSLLQGKDYRTLFLVSQDNEDSD